MLCFLTKAAITSHQYTFKGTLYPKIEKNTSFMLSFELDLQSSYGDHCEDERPPSNIMKLSGTCKTCGGNFHVSFSQSAAYHCTDEPRIFHITYIWFNVWPGWAVMLLSDCSSLPSMLNGCTQIDPAWNHCRKLLLFLVLADDTWF